MEMPPLRLLWMLGAMLGALGLGSMVRYLGLRKAPAEIAAQRMSSLKTWWILGLLVSAALVLGKAGVCLLMTAASWLALREWIRLTATRTADRPAALAAQLYVLAHYGLMLAGYQQATLALAPLLCVLSLQVIQVAQGATDGYIRSTGGLTWGVIILVYALGHAALLMTLPETSNPVAGNGGWLLYLVLLTECNDIAQALVGRRFGAHNRHRLAPRVSPNKTWEGFLGGALVTLVMAVALAPLLTPWLANWGGEDGGSLAEILWPLAAGLVATVGGLFGDINMSAVKRDAKVKDGSDLLPGMGGAIDRVDSLTFTAPLFYYLVVAGL